MAPDDAITALPIWAGLSPLDVDGARNHTPGGRAPTRRRSADVAVIGAGLSGLIAAERVRASGRSVVVLEARPDRVGGRLESAEHDGHAVDLGGAWIGAAHARAAGLAAELSLSTWTTHAEGEPVVIHAGRRMRGRGYKLRHMLATLDGRRVSRRLDRLSEQISTSEPWSSPGALELDSQTLESWLASATSSERARRTLGGTLANLIGIEPRYVSLLHALFYLRSSGGMHTMLADEGGAQDGLVHGGAQSLATGLAERLGDIVELGAPVRRIEHLADEVRVRADGIDVEAAAAIVALPPALSAHIDYTPGLPADRDGLAQSVPHGDVLKIVAVYKDAFWRSEGLSGEAWGEELPFSFSYDMSTPDAAPGVLTLFFVGDRAKRFRGLSDSDRRSALLSSLRCCFGESGATPVALLSRDWASEKWTRGAYCGYMPPGVWTRHGRALRAPVGPISWAGTETAIEHSGYMEGAIESGERAAAEVLARLPAQAARA